MSTATKPEYSTPIFSTEEAAAEALSRLGHTLWESHKGAWVVKACACAAGNEAGPPPEDPGKFEGEIVRKPCQPIRS